MSETESRRAERETTLASLRYMEMESVRPLEVAADLEPPDVAETLYDMAEDHDRHRQDLDLLLAETDHRPVNIPDTFREQVAYRVRAAEQSVDETEALEGLLVVERFGAERYEQAIASGLLDDQRAMLNRHLADQLRHERYLRERVPGA